VFDSPLAYHKKGCYFLRQLAWPNLGVIMKLSLRTVFSLCTLLLVMQFGALVHAGEHVQDVDHVACQLCSHLDRFEDASLPSVLVLDKSKVTYLPGISPGKQKFLLKPVSYKHSRAPPFV